MARRTLNRYKMRGVRNWKRPQPDRVYQAEDGGVCPNAKRQRDDGRQERTGSAPEPAQGEANVMNEVDHLTPPLRPGWRIDFATMNRARAEATGIN
jgi:hypothetical protein